MRYHLAACLALTFSQVSLASNNEDVIYKTDGSILRGHLIEQDFENGLYKLQILGGSIFVIRRDDISKITKEAPLASSTPVPVQASPKPTAQAQAVTQPIPRVSYTSERPSDNSITYVVPSRKDTTYPSHVIHFGLSNRNYTVSNVDNGFYQEDLRWNLDGAAYSYQLHFNKHWSTYVEYADTRFDHVTDEDGDETYFYYDSDFDDIRATTFQALAILSSNNGRGWQFYLGAGPYRERINYDGRAHRSVGAVYNLGMGYAWQNLQAHFRFFGYESSDYASEIEDVTSSTIQIGYRL